MMLVYIHLVHLADYFLKMKLHDSKIQGNRTYSSMRKEKQPFTTSFCFFLQALKSDRARSAITSLADELMTRWRENEMRGSPFDLRAINFA